MNNPDPRTRVEHACADLTKVGQPVTFTAVADATGLSRATLYRNPDLRAIIAEHRTHAAQAGTLGGLSRDIAHLRTALEAIADKVRRQEERLRRLERLRGHKPAE
jgi:uncharacterized coiled-coil protein SlyX